MLEALFVILALMLFALLLIPIVAVFWKRRWWAGAAGLVAPFFLLDSLSGYSQACAESASVEACDRAGTLSFLAFVVALGVVVWVVAAAILPRSKATETYRDDTQESTREGRPRFDRNIAVVGFAIASLGALIGALVYSLNPPFSYDTDSAAPIAVLWDLAAYVVLAVVVARHRTRYPEGSGGWWVAAGAVAAAVAVGFVAATAAIGVPSLERFGQAAPLIAAAVAAVCVGLLKDTQDL